MEDKKKDYDFVVKNGERYWRTYALAAKNPERHDAGRVLRWVGAKDGTYHEERR